MKKMPVVFCGHGSPMLALEDNKVTEGLKKRGEEILHDWGKPKAILMVSAHWYGKGTFVQDQENPKQVYDMYGFPDELYDVKYPVKGSHELSKEVQGLLSNQVQVNNDWGIDHGAWTVLVHMFPKADIPVVQLSVDSTLSPQGCHQVGKMLMPLLDEGYLLMGSGNIAHNLRMVDWDSPTGSEETMAFDKCVKDAVRERKDDILMDYRTIPYASTAVPTPDHYLPLLYTLGMAGDSKADIFNEVCDLGSISMTSFLFH